jgi:hypothetical protein
MLHYVRLEVMERFLGVLLLLCLFFRDVAHPCVDFFTWMDILTPYLRSYQHLVYTPGLHTRYIGMFVIAMYV